MNKIKDFFYNKNDILVALIIVGVAAAVIYVRIQDIMRYPATLMQAQPGATTSQTAAPQATTKATVPQE